MPSYPLGSIRVDNRYSQTGIIAAVGLLHFNVYWEYRRGVWSKPSGDPVRDALLAGGILASWDTQGEVGARLGLSRKTVLQSVEILRRHGWVTTEAHRTPTGRALSTNLGVVLDGAESFDADLWLNEAWMRLVVEAKSRDLQHPSQIPEEERRRLVASWVEEFAAYPLDGKEPDEIQPPSNLLPLNAPWWRKDPETPN